MLTRRPLEKLGSPVWEVDRVLIAGGHADECRQDEEHLCCQCQCHLQGIELGQKETATACVETMGTGHRRLHEGLFEHERWRPKVGTSEVVQMRADRGVRGKGPVSVLLPPARLRPVAGAGSRWVERPRCTEFFEQGFEYVCRDHIFPLGDCLENCLGRVFLVGLLWRYTAPVERRCL